MNNDERDDGTAAAEPRPALESAAGKVGSILTGKPEGYAIDPTMIVTIISVLISVFSGCLARRTPAQVAKAAKRLSLFEQAVVLSHCRRACPTNREARQMFSAITEAAAGADESEVIECCEEVIASRLL